MRCKPIGPRDARIMIIGEAPGEEEDRRGLPFVGTSGGELDRMLADAGLSRESLYITNAIKERPASNDITIWIRKGKTPKGDESLLNGMCIKPFVLNELWELQGEIEMIKPRVVIALGGVALWALTGETSITKWRGSQMRKTLKGHEFTVIPTFHPAGVLRKYDWRFPAVEDMRKAKRLAEVEVLGPPDTDNWNCIIRPTFARVTQWLGEVKQAMEKGPVDLICDLEIREKRIICMGLAVKDREAICIPFLPNKGHYWKNEKEEAQIVAAFAEIVGHVNCRLVNQNLAFDIQFLWNEWLIWPKVSFDTMVAQAVIFPGTPAALDYLASIYSPYYLYWKDDGKFWKEFVEDERLWRYNCYDAIYTWRVKEAQRRVIGQLGLTEQVEEQFRIQNHVQDMMHRGVLVDARLKSQYLVELIEVIERLKVEVHYLAGTELWVEKAFSNAKMVEFFYGALRLPVIVDRKTKSPTCDDDAMKRIVKFDPLLKPLCERISIIRSYATAVNVCRARMDLDGRWRCSYRVAGAETLRFTSSENPLGSGTNLQNITIGRDILEG